MKIFTGKLEKPPDENTLKQAKKMGIALFNAGIFPNDGEPPETIEDNCEQFETFLKLQREFIEQKQKQIDAALKMQHNPNENA